MQEHAAVFRTGDVLDEGCTKMDAIYQHLVSVSRVGVFHGHQICNILMRLY
jgi:hypothetical protein